MATVLEMVRAQLLLYPSVTALVGTRIYPVVAPQQAVFPRVVLTKISDAPVSTYDGRIENCPRICRVQVDVYGRTYLEAHAVSRAIELVLGNLLGNAEALYGMDLTAVLENVEDLYEDETQLHRVTADYLMTVTV